jgi:glycine dehydrogenase subunit 2
MTKTVFEKSQTGQHAYSLPKSAPEFEGFQPEAARQRRTQLPLPELSEIDLTRHFCELASRNVGIDNQFYPLGSCTMKLNPRISEWCARLPGFVNTHPLAPEDSVQGNLQIMAELGEFLCCLCGMQGASLLPCAGAQGEYAAIKMAAAYHKKRGEVQRDEILIPDDAHGTNPATAAMAGFKAVRVKIGADGELDLGHLKSLLSEKTAALMMTNPNTLGIFSRRVVEITQAVHDAGGVLFYDGANLNAILNVVRPGEMGFDLMHLNLHKTFATPHGGGGPGAGPILCKQEFMEFLPVPRIEQVPDEKRCKIIWEAPSSIGQICAFHGNFAVCVRAYLYAKLHGNYGLRRIAEQAVLNANYLKAKVQNLFHIPYPGFCMHEFVVQADNYLQQQVRALDIAKRLLDYGFHPPTIYFPLLVKECMLIEPTESESKATLDCFVVALEKIAREIESEPELVRTAPHSKPVGRLDEVRAAKHPILRG